MKISRLFLGVVGSAVIATSAIAADLPQAPTVVAPPPPPPMAAPAFKWSGAYIGVAGLYYFESGYSSLGVSAFLGYNVVRSRLLFGAEAEVNYTFGGPNYDVVGRVRAGLLVGEKLLLYGVGGFGWYGGVSSGTYFLAGGGAELAHGEHLSLRAEAAAILYGGAMGGQVELGAVWHLGR